MPSQRFPGFEDTDRKVAVSVVDLPGIAYAELERSALAKDQPGITGVEHEKFSFSGGTGVLVTGQTTQDGVALKKWILLASGNRRRT